MSTSIKWAILYVNYVSIKLLRKNSFSFKALTGYTRVKAGGSEGTRWSQCDMSCDGATVQKSELQPSFVEVELCTHATVPSG